MIIIHQAMIHGNFGNILQLPDQGDVVFFSKIKNQESTQSKKNVMKMISFVKTSSKHNLSNEKTNIITNGAATYSSYCKALMINVIAEHLRNSMYEKV